MHGDAVIRKNERRIRRTLKAYGKGTIVEVGSTRDAGSTYHLAALATSLGYRFLTIDPSEAANTDAQRILAPFANPNLQAVRSTGEEFLAHYEDNDICLAYLDGFDIVTDWPHKESTIEFYRKSGIDLLRDGNRISAEVHLETTRYVADNLVHGGFICFDDTWRESGEWNGKGAKAVPWLLARDFKLIGRARPRSRPLYSHGVLLCDRRRL